MLASATEKLGQFGVGMPEFIDRIADHVNGFKSLIDFNRPSFCFVNVDKSEEHVELHQCLPVPPVGVDLGQGGPVIFVGSDWSDFRDLRRLELRNGQCIDAIAFGMRPNESYESGRSAELEGHHQSKVFTRNCECSKKSRSVFRATTLTLSGSQKVRTAPAAHAGCGASASISFTSGTTLVAYSSMLVISLSCGRGPAEYFSWKRDSPSVFTVVAILRATVSGEPT